jgi:hypothetical protein
MDKDYISSTEVAKLLHRSRDTINQRADSGWFAQYGVQVQRTSDGRRMFNREQVEALAERLKHKPWLWSR